MPYNIEKMNSFTSWINQNFQKAKRHHLKIFAGFILFWFVLIYLLFFDRYFNIKGLSKTACAFGLVLGVIYTLQELIQMSYSKKKSYIKNNQNKFDVLFIISSFAYFISRILIIDEVIGDSLLIYANVVMIILAIEKSDRKTLPKTATGVVDNINHV